MKHVEETVWGVPSSYRRSQADDFMRWVEAQRLDGARIDNREAAGLARRIRKGKSI